QTMHRFLRTIFYSATAMMEYLLIRFVRSGKQRPQLDASGRALITNARPGNSVTDTAKHVKSCAKTAAYSIQLINFHIKGTEPKVICRRQRVVRMALSAAQPRRSL